MINCTFLISLKAKSYGVFGGFFGCVPLIMRGWSKPKMPGPIFCPSPCRAIQFDIRLGVMELKATESWMFTSRSLRPGCTNKDSFLHPIKSWFNLIINYLQIPAGTGQAAGLHPGQVASSSQGWHVGTSNHSLWHSHLREIWSDQLTSQACLWGEHADSAPRGPASAG